MPGISGIDPASLAMGATQIGQSLLNSAITGATNRKNRKFAEKMAQRSRDWALQDQASINEYNSPASQMQRYKAAGLNPHLIYGQSNEGAAVRSTDTAKYEAQAPQLDFNPTGIMHSYNETRMANIGADNALKQGQVLDEEIALKRAQQADTLASAKQKGVNTDRQLFDLGIESELRPQSLEYRMGQNRKQAADTEFTLDSNERARVMQQPTLAKMAAETAKIKAEKQNIDITGAEIHQRIANMKLEAKLKEDEIQLRKAGLTPNSPTYQKVISKHADAILDAYRKVKSVRDNFWNPKKFNGGKAPSNFKY